MVGVWVCVGRGVIVKVSVGSGVSVGGPGSSVGVGRFVSLGCPLGCSLGLGSGVSVGGAADVTVPKNGTPIMPRARWDVGVAVGWMAMSVGPTVTRLCGVGPAMVGAFDGTPLPRQLTPNNTLRSVKPKSTNGAALREPTAVDISNKDNDEHY